MAECQISRLKEITIKHHRNGDDLCKIFYILKIDTMLTVQIKRYVMFCHKFTKTATDLTVYFDFSFKQKQELSVFGSIEKRVLKIYAVIGIVNDKTKTILRLYIEAASV